MLPGEVRSSITESDRPKGGDLEALQSRAAHLRSFDLAMMAERKTMIARLFLRFPAGGKATEEEVTAYAQDLASFPLWAIVKGIGDIIAGLVLKAPEFRPSSLQVRGAVEARMAPAREELALIATILGAKVVPDAAVLPSLDWRREMAGQARELMRSAALPVDLPRKAHPRLPNSFGAGRGYEPMKVDMTKYEPPKGRIA